MVARDGPHGPSLLRPEDEQLEEEQGGRGDRKNDEWILVTPTRENLVDYFQGPLEGDIVGSENAVEAAKILEEKGGAHGADQSDILGAPRSGL